PVAQLLAGLEERDVLFGDRDAVAGARVAAEAGIAALDRERAKAAQLDPVAAGEGGGDLVEDRVDDHLDIALVKVRIGLRKLLNEFRFCHSGGPCTCSKSTVPNPPPSVKAGHRPPVHTGGYATV